MPFSRITFKSINHRPKKTHYLKNNGRGELTDCFDQRSQSACSLEVADICFNRTSAH